MDYRISLVGLCIGFLIGLTGMGGGALLAPILILLFRLPPLWAVGTDIAYSAVTKALGSVVHIRQNQVNFRVALWLSCGSIPAILLSVGLAQYIHEQYPALVDGFILHSIGCTLLLVAVLLLLKPSIMRRLERKEALQPKGCWDDNGPARCPGDWETRYRPVMTTLIGAGVGFLVGLTSIGSGTLIILSLAMLFPRLPSKELVGTDIFQAFMLLMAGAFAYLSAVTINWPVVGLLLIGSLPGVFLGSKLNKFIPDRYIGPALAIVLALSAWKLI